jgi:CHAT domain-containing protein
MTCSQLSFAQNITTDTTLANSYFEKAGIFQDSVQYDSAIVYFEKASALYQEHEQWRNYLQSETKHGVCYQKQWQLDLAIATITPAIKKSLQHINENDTIVADAYHDLAFQYAYQSKYDSALFYWEKTLIIRKELLGEKHTDVAGSYNNIGIVYDEKNEYDLALEYHFKSLQIRKELLGEKHTLVAVSYNNIGLVYWNKNEYDLALEYHFKSLEIKKELLGEKHTDVVYSYNNIGIVYAEKDEYDLALEYLFKALQISKELLGEKHTLVAGNYNNIGAVYAFKNEYDLALQYYFKALQIKKELLGEKHTDVAGSYNNIGNVYKEKNEYDLALEYHFKSLQITKELLGEKHTGVAGSYSNIGNVYKEKNEYDLALEYHFKSLQITKELLGEKHTLVAGNYNNIGAVYKEKNEYDLALQYYFKSLQIRKELLGEKHTDVARSYSNIGNVYADKNEYDLVLQYYQKGIASSLRNFNDTVNVNSVPFIKDYLSWDELLADLQTKAKLFVTLSTYSKPDSDSDSLQQKPLSGIINTARADYLKLALRHYQACDTLINQARQSIITKSDKLILGEQASEVYKGAVNVCINLSASSRPDNVSYYKEQAFYFSEKNKSSVLLEALAGAEAQKFAGIPDTLLKEEHKLQIDIALYKRILAEQPDSAKEIIFRDKLFKANRQYDDLIAVFESQYSEYFELKYNLKPTGVKEIQKTLDNETAIISYLTGDSIITIFTITKNNLDIKTVPVIENLAYTIGVFRYDLLHTNSSLSARDYKEYAYKMYSQLIPENAYKKIKNLIIIPDAELSMIPFEALLTENPEDKEWKELPYLVKKYNISYSYSANLFYKTFPKEPTTKIEYTDLNDWLAFAPVFDDSNTAGLSMRTRELLEQLDSELDDTTGTRGMLIKGGYISPLPETESEVQAIFKQFDEKDKKALVQIKKNANEEFIKSGELRKYRLIHFATHGFVNTLKPELSGLLLAQDTTINEDGILYSGEIYNLKLNADLTVLSACETGLGKIKKGEGLIGLTRALLYAGSKNIIVSLWKVADKSTSDLMIDFYKNLLEAKQEKKEFSQALQQAKLKMIDEGKYAHPFYWSPFILIGK